MLFIFHQFEATESCTEVADELNRQGFKTKERNTKRIGGCPFSCKNVRRILQNPYYKGYVTHKDQVYKGEHEAMIDEATWKRIQTIFQKYGSDRKSCKSKNSSF